MVLWVLNSIRGWGQYTSWVVVMAVLGCVPDNQLDFPTAQNYFPLRVGDYKIFQVSEIRIAPYNIETELNYQIRTLVTDSFPNADGKYSYVISRFKRTNPTDAWVSLDTWTGRANDREVVITEGNIPYQKISYPVESTRKWNGNRYNSESTNEICPEATATSCDLYAFGAVNAPFQSGMGLSFTKTIEVVENDDEDLFVKYDVRRTIYALNVGLVYREINIRQYCTQDPCYGQQLVENGQVMVMELKEYGRE